MALVAVEVPSASQWRSVRPGKIQWTEDDVAALARAIHSSLPCGTINLLNSDEWKGGPLLALPDSKGVKTPTAKEISANYWFLKPVVMASPRKVPSAYFLTDVFLYFDGVVMSKKVSSGWLGRAYMYENAKARDEAEKRRVDDGIARTVRSIKSDLETALKQDLDGELWSSYEKWSSKALKDYGDHVYGHLACPDAYLHWVRDQKAEDPHSTTHVAEKREVRKNPLNRALSMMDLGATLDEPVPGSLDTPACKKPRFAKPVSEHLTITPPAVVGEQTAKRLQAKKAQDRDSANMGGKSSVAGDRMVAFHSYDLIAMEIPECARPRCGGNHLGKHGYTLKSSNGAVIEVLLKTRAYIVKRCCTSMADKSQQGQVTWGKYGGARHAWHIAVERAGFGEVSLV